MGSEARARLGLWFLLAVALFSFNQVFDTGDYPGPALLGMLMATGIAVGLRRLGMSTWITLLASGLALFWYLSLVFEAPRTLWSLPTPDSITALWRAVQRAVEHSQIDYAPVPLRPGYAIVVVAALWGSTTIGEIATFRWRRPLAAALLPIVIFAVALTVGTGTGSAVFVGAFLAALLTYWGLESSHRMRAWGRWVSAWSHHREAEPESITGDLARRVGAIAVAAAMVSPLFLPALEDGLLSWRSGIGPNVGSGPGDGGGRLNPWVSIVPDLPSQTDEILFEVTASDSAYWRISSLEIFDGINWQESRQERAEAAQGSIGGPPVAITSSRPLAQTVEVRGLRGEFLPAALAPSSVVRLDDGGASATAGIDYDPDSGAILVDDELAEGHVYEILSNTPAVDYKSLNEDRPAESGDIDDVYLELRDPLSPQAGEQIQTWISEAEAETPFEELIAIQDELRAFDYTLTPAQPQGDDYITDFLLRTREGYCQQFATAFAVIARHLGYPARVSVGFLPGERDDIRGKFTVRGTDAHAWPEVYFESAGWITFEPTARGTSPRPPHTLPSSVAANGGGTGGVGLSGNPFSDIDVPEGAGQGGSAFDAPGGGDASIDPGFANPREDAGGFGEDGADLTAAEWQRTFSRLMTAVAIAFFLFLLAVPGLKEWRIRRRYGSAAGPDALAAAAFVHFEDEAAELADARSPWESALSYADRLVTGSKLAPRSAVRLATIYEAAAFAATDISAEQAQEAKRLARTLQSQLWHQASWWSKLGRLFSPSRLRTDV